MRIYMTPEELNAFEKMIEVTDIAEVRKLIDYDKRVIDIHPVFMLCLSDNMIKKSNNPFIKVFIKKFRESLKTCVNLIVNINKKK